MNQSEFSEHLTRWLDPPQKTIKRLALFAGYTSIYVGFIRNGKRKASPRLIGEFLQAMWAIDQNAPSIKPDYTRLPDTERNRAAIAGQKIHNGGVCAKCGTTEKYRGYQCVECLRRKRRAARKNP